MTATERPLPGPDPLTENFWNGARNHQLVIQRCRSCGHFIHYPQPVCPVCTSTDLGYEEVSGDGTVYSFTQVTRGFHPFFVERAPYVLIVVELAEQPGLRMMSELVDFAIDDVAIGMAVEVTFAQASEGVTLPMFRPAA